MSEIDFELGPNDASFSGGQRRRRGPHFTNATRDIDREFSGRTAPDVSKHHPRSHQNARTPDRRGLHLEIHDRQIGQAPLTGGVSDAGQSIESLIHTATRSRRRKRSAAKEEKHECRDGVARIDKSTVIRVGRVHTANLESTEKEEVENTDRVGNVEQTVRRGITSPKRTLCRSGDDCQTGRDEDKHSRQNNSSQTKCVHVHVELLRMDN